MRLGVLGGAFNPPHIAHLVLAQEAFAGLSLDRVLLVPVGEAAHREIEQDPGAEVRLNLCELAAAGDERLEASRVEVDRDGPSYTVDTLRALRAAAPDDELVLLLGGDQATALGDWREPDEILRLATVACVERGEARREELRRALARLEGGERAVIFDMPAIGVSSTLVRRRVAAGLPIRYLVPEAVAGLVAERGLYRSAAAVGAAR